MRWERDSGRGAASGAGGSRRGWGHPEPGGPAAGGGARGRAVLGRAERPVPAGRAAVAALSRAGWGFCRPWCFPS